MRIAIHKNDIIFKHSTLWTEAWVEYCKNNQIEFELIDCFRYDIIEQLKRFDCLLWHFSHYALQDMLFARSILNSAKNMGLKVFPDFNTAWHFDDKVAETYLLESVNSPIPQSWMFYVLQDCVDWFNNRTEYPLVAKLRCGSGSQNVKLIKNKKAGIKYAKKMFGKGLNSAPSILYKASSQLKSAKDWEMIKKRIKRIPDFIQSLSNARKLFREKGYTFFQEFIPNRGFDLKIVVVGDKLSFIARHIRKGEFRASGSGDFYFDRSIVSEDILRSAFEASDKLGFQCMGYDYIVDERTNTGKIVEVSYGFSHTTVLMAGGYWDRNLVWHDEPLNAPVEVLQKLIKQV